MKPIGDLKDKVEKANSKEEAKEIIEKAGMQLTADELNLVVGGTTISVAPRGAGPGHLPKGDPGPGFHYLSEQEKEAIRQGYIDE